MLVFTSVEDLQGRLGHELGVSDWLPTGLADTETARFGPFRATIARGFQMLALGPMLMDRVLTLEGLAVANQGLNRVRFPAALPCGALVRLRLSLEGIAKRTGSSDVTLLLAFECPGQEKPVCVAESVLRVFDPQ
jgi:acyl dehydratase